MVTVPELDAFASSSVSAIDSVSSDGSGTVLIARTPRPSYAYVKAWDEARWFRGEYPKTCGPTALSLPAESYDTARLVPFSTTEVRLGSVPR
jgi:hypothetical protein